VPEPEPVIPANEQPFFDLLVPTIPSAPPVNVDRVVREGDDLGWNETTVVMHTPGHTPGGIAIHLPDSRVVFTGDTVASMDGRPILGPFNVARVDAIRSFRRLAELDVDVACFGQRAPTIGGAGAESRRRPTRWRSRAGLERDPTRPAQAGAGLSMGARLPLRQAG
jgi:glyoxylase-like metal-dependent hydrolase (beta-lactamase superfamily II)